MLTGDRSFCARAEPDIANRLKQVLYGSKKQSAVLLPGGTVIAAVEGCMKALSPDALRARLLESFGTISRVHDLSALRELEQDMLLFDAELAFDGYSRQWRHEAAQAAQDALVDTNLRAAIEAGLAAAGEVKVRGFDVLVPLASTAVDDGDGDEEGDDDEEETAVLDSSIKRANAVNLVSKWKSPEALAAVDAENVRRVLRLKVEARDVHSAAEDGRDQVARAEGLWRLQGAPVRLAGQLVIRDDASSKPAEVFPAEAPLDVRPAGIAQYVTARRDHEGDESIRRITDSLDQLAQARTASHGAALADLWTVAETLFGGLATDRSADVSDRLAGLAEMLMVRDRLRWLAQKAGSAGESVGLVRAPAEPDARWGARCALDGGTAILDALVDAHPLAWLRVAEAQRWRERASKVQEKPVHLTIDLDATHDRVAAIGNRAYLVRNLFLHQGNPRRARALAVTVPAFAAVLRAVLGHINQSSGSYRLPLVESEYAQLRARQVASAWLRAPDGGVEVIDNLVDLKDD